MNEAIVSKGWRLLLSLSTRRVKPLICFRIRPSQLRILLVTNSTLRACAFHGYMLMSIIFNTFTSIQYIHVICHCRSLLPSTVFLATWNPNWINMSIKCTRETVCIFRTGIDRRYVTYGINVHPRLIIYEHAFDRVKQNEFIECVEKLIL